MDLSDLSQKYKEIGALPFAWVTERWPRVSQPSFELVAHAARWRDLLCAADRQRDLFAISPKACHPTALAQQPFAGQLRSLGHRTAVTPKADRCLGDKYLLDA